LLENALSSGSTVSVNTGGGVVSGIDANNTSSTPLLAGATFTGVWTKVSDYGEIKSAYDADVNDSDCFLELSYDGINVNTSLSLPPQLKLNGRFGAIHSLNPSIPYFRVVYTNGATNQGTFNLTTILLVETGNGFVSRATQVIDRYTDVKNQRIVNNPAQDRNFGLINYQEAKRKFGTNEVVGTSFETIAPTLLSTYVFPQTAETLQIRAGGNVNDDVAGTGARTLTIEGLNENWLEVIEDLTLAGASASLTTSNLFYRVNKVSIKEVGTYGSDNLGDIVIENSTSNQALAVVEAGIGNTRQAVYTVPAGKTAWITEIFPSVGSGDSADVKLSEINFADDFTAPFTSIKHYEWGVVEYNGSTPVSLATFLKIPEKNDIICEAKKVSGGGGGARVALDFDFILTEN
jgi:hypothetical protein